MPERRGIVTGVLDMDLPALVRIILQGQGEAGNFPVLSEVLQLLASDLRQAWQVAHPQLFAGLLDQALKLFPAVCLLAFKQQITDVHQL
ncbi:hypothetical protein D3C84_1036960 [compost metagenome]